MLKLVDINKVYKVGDMTVQALKGVSLEFRKNEMVSILGPSGCGKTTMLNIIGGLDKYTSGDLIINGISTKEYRDCDWDAYRNASIGFVFQSYNLISHQTVLENVELALTLSGVGPAERRQRAIKALQEVGLGDQLKKKPNQLSGGQMQRVAIARALINNPDILLADEPTGALDSVTSVQIMDLLKEVAKTRLVIMVTHNGELAEEYSDRIIRLLDGKIISDTNPVKSEDQKTTKQRPKKTSMSLRAALKLSLRNLLTKKVRTFITAFAGSIGIIGVALILALSSGFNNYIDKMQEETMSSYPITISSSSFDVSSVTSMIVQSGNLEKFPTAQKIFINKITEKAKATFVENNVTEEYVDAAVRTIDPSLVNDIIYDTGAKIHLYKKQSVDANGRVQMKSIDMSPQSALGGWKRIVDNQGLIESQYDILAGKLPTQKDEVILCIDSYNQLMDMIVTGNLGVSTEDLEEKDSFTFDEIFGLEYKILLNDALYEQRSNGTFYTNTLLEAEEYEDSLTIKIVGIVRLKEGAAGGALSGAIGYHGSLVDYIIEENTQSKVVKWQKAHPDTHYSDGYSYLAAAYATYLAADDDLKKLPYEEWDSKVKKNVELLAKSYYDKNMGTLGGSTVPTKIEIYPKDFDSKEKIRAHLDAYNDQLKQQGKEPVVYSDMMGLIFEAVGVLIGAVTSVLVAFTSISLVVSSIMIGIITYISVLERTKEIGILKSLGSRKKDISRVFNAETGTIGFVAGLIGVSFTWLISLPINQLLLSLTSIPNLMHLGIIPAIILVGISMGLTLIAGFVPAKVAARKDAVIALRTE